MIKFLSSSLLKGCYKLYFVEVYIVWHDSGLDLVCLLHMFGLLVHMRRNFGWAGLPTTPGMI